MKADPVQPRARHQRGQALVVGDFVVGVGREPEPHPPVDRMDRRVGAEGLQGAPHRHGAGARRLLLNRSLRLLLRPALELVGFRLEF